MREIKFRGKRKDNGEWVYGYYVEVGISYILPFNKTLANDFIEVTPETVGQYIDKKDKKGVEIYEGDILSYLDFDGKFIVKWGHWGWRLEGTIPKEDRHISQWPPITLPSGNFEYIEVIGNKTDNPELLE